MKKKISHIQSPRCELIQLELPLEPPKLQTTPTLQTSTQSNNTGRKETQIVKMFADDRLDMTFFRFCVFLEIFASKLITANNETPFKNDEEVKDYAYDYATKILRANLKNTPKRTNKEDGNKT